MPLFPFRPEAASRALRRVAVTVLFGLGALAAGPGLAAADATATYAVTLSGINVASVKVRLKDDGGNYAVGMSADVVGMGQLVASGNAYVDSIGRSSAKGLTAEEFRLKTETNNQTFSSSVQFARGAVTGFKVNPPLVDNRNRVPIERSQLGAVNDFIAPFLVRGGALDASVCNRSARIFTGVERFDIKMSFAEMQTATSQRTAYQGPVALCRLRYTPVSGHFTTSEITTYLSGSDRILIWYAPLAGTDYFIPYRILLGTSVGDLSFVLTGLN